MDGVCREDDGEGWCCLMPCPFFLDELGLSDELQERTCPALGEGFLNSVVIVVILVAIGNILVAIVIVVAIVLVVANALTLSYSSWSSRFVALNSCVFRQCGRY